MEGKKYKEKYDRKLNKKDKVIKRTIDFRWIFTITIIAFIITMVLSTSSGIVMDNVSVLIGIVIVIFFIIIGVVTDMIGIAVTSADEKPFHSMASKQVKGSKTAIKMLKNAEKVSAFCNDVIGDICNIISGSAGAVIAVGLSTKYGSDEVITALLITSVIAALTIGGKAMGKSFAVNKSEIIVYNFAKLISVFWK